MKEFILHSDESVLSGKFKSLVHQIKDKKEEIGEGLLGKWQSTEYVLRNIQDVRKRIAAFRAANVSTLTDVQTKTLDALNARLDAVQSKAATEVAGTDLAPFARTFPAK